MPSAKGPAETKLFDTGRFAELDQLIDQLISVIDDENALLASGMPASLAATTGIHSAQDVLKMMMAGADVAMMCSALLQHGPQHIAAVLADLQRWMEEKDYVSIAQMKGSMSQRSVAEPAAFERANYMKALNSWRSII